MATAVQNQRQTTPKHDAYVESQLDRARRRIRTLDLTTALLGFLAGTLAYGIVMALLDNALDLSSSVLHVSFFLYLAAAVGYLGLAVIRPLSRQINPYFAARKVEENLPDAKNSVVNYLDLRDDERLPAPVHNAVGARAARDLAKVDIDSAVSARRAGFAGGTAGLMIFIVLVVLFAFGSRKFFSHLGRVFLPFNDGSVATRTEIELLEPDRDPLTVSNLQSVTVRVRIEGTRPDEVKLITRPSLDETAETVRYLSPEQDPDRRDQWAITLTPENLNRGVYYRVVAGDASTDERRIEVQATPSIESESFRATFKARPYISQGQERIQVRNRNLRGYNGTILTIDAQANRKLESAAMVFSWEEGPKDKPIRKERFVDAKVDGQHLQVPNFLMAQSGLYRLRFKSTDGEVYEEPNSFPLDVTPDTAPKVELTEPGKDTALAADALLKLEGKATDDIGVKSLTLHLTADGKSLKPRPYRSEEEIRLKDGGFPRDLDYKDDVPLAKLTDAGGQAFALKAGMTLEYWLEASDACDFPRPNVGLSKKFKVVILEKRQDPEQAKADEKKAEQERQEHQKKQDEKIAEENRKREEDRKRQEQANRDATQPDQPKDPKNNTKPDKPTGQNQQGGNPEDDKKRQEQNNRIEDAVRNHERGTGKPDKPEQQKPGEENQTGKGKPDQKQTGQPDPKPDQAKQGETGMQEKPGTTKDQGKPMQNQQAAGEKDQPPQQQPAQAKDNPKPKPDQKKDDRASAKPQQGKPDPNCAQCKENGGGKPGNQQGAGKNAGGMKPDEQTAQSKDNAGGMGGQPQASQAKQGGQPQGGQPQGGQQEADRAQSKDAGQNATAQGTPKPATKDMIGGTGAAQDKAAAPKEQPAAAAKDGAIGDNRTAAKTPQKPPEEARTPDVKQMAQDLQNPDPAKRAEARKQLEQVAEKSVDGAARDAARNELDKTKKPPTGGGQPQQTADSKENKNGNAGATSAGKEGPKNDMTGAQAKAKGGPGKEEQKKDQAGAKGSTKGQDDAHKFEQLAEDLQKQKEKNDAAGQQATKEEIAKAFKQMMDDLRSDDPQRQEDARKALEEIGKAAKDDKKNREATPDKTIKELADELLRDAQSDDPKKSEPARRALKEMQEFAKQNQNARDAIPPEQQKKMDEIAKQEEAKQAGNSGSGGMAKQGPADPTKPTPTAADPSHKQHARDLTLDKFSDKVKKQILQEAGVNEADLEAIREWKERTANAGPDGDPLKPIGKALPGGGIERVIGVDPSGRVEGSSDGLPPLEYLDTYRRFTERISQLQKTPGNK